MANRVQIILMQRRSGGSIQYRIAKLVGTVRVHTQSKPSEEYHVGDWIDEQTAADLSLARAYEVTVTERQ